MFGATSNNDARMAARSYGRALTIDTYDPAKVGAWVGEGERGRAGWDGIGRICVIFFFFLVELVCSSLQ